MTQKTVERKSETTMGRRLASQRALRGWSQEEAAAQAGLRQAYLSLLENDKAPSPPLGTVSRLAQLYGVTLDYLVKGEAA